MTIKELVICNEWTEGSVGLKPSAIVLIDV